METTTTTTTTTFREGDRVEEDESAGVRGTIRYVGPVATSKDASAVYYGTVYSIHTALSRATIGTSVCTTLFSLYSG